MQESHVTESIEREFYSYWGSNCFFSNGSSSARGVVIIIPDYIDFKMIKLTTDKEGRYIIINGIFNGRELTLVNLYAPTQDKPKEQLDILGEIIEQVSDCIHKLIWLGDFNIHLTSLDAYKDDNFKVGKSANRLSVFMEDSQLMDIWRMLNPDAKRFTWRRYTNRGISQSRLDYFIISDGLSYYVDKCDIKPSFLSDHNPILLGFKSETKQTRGRGTWKFNSSLLRDNEYVKNMNELLDTQVNKYDKMADKGLAWDVIKSEIRGYTIGYSSYKSKQKKN